MNPITYDLSAQPGFYAHLSALTDQVEARAALAFPDISSLRDGARTDDELRVELLCLAMYWRAYGATARSVRLPWLWLGALLWSLRQIRALKRRVDPLRGWLATHILKPRPSVAAPLTPRGARRLLRWMAATGEFPEEVGRLRRVLEHRQPGWLPAAEALAAWFTPAARARLGAWTRHVDAFAQRALQQTQPREDAVLRARGRDDYHLIMVISEVMNRALRAGYRRRPRRVVLVPGCVRRPGPCAAKGEPGDLACQRCDPSCGVARLAARGAGRFDVRVIPHASDFTRQLSRWADEPDVALVASACVPHLLTGGYQMRALGIPSQCVFLEGSGCRRHWDPKGRATTLDLSRLEALIALDDAA